MTDEAPTSAPAPVEEGEPAEAEAAAPVEAGPAVAFNSFHRHVARAFSGLEIEQACPCAKAPCGMVDEAQADPACRQHHPRFARTMRQAHQAQRCPGAHADDTERPAPEEPSAPAPTPGPEAHHSGRYWGRDVSIEDLCRCKKEPCGLVDLTRADPHCEQHGPEAARTMRQGHRAEECTGQRPYPLQVTRAQQVTYIREQLSDRRAQEERLAQRLEEARADRAATEDWLCEVLMELETAEPAPGANGPTVAKAVADAFAFRFSDTGLIRNLAGRLTAEEVTALSALMTALNEPITAAAWRSARNAAQ